MKESKLISEIITYKETILLHLKRKNKKWLSIPVHYWSKVFGFRGFILVVDLDFGFNEGFSFELLGWYSVEWHIFAKWAELSTSSSSPSDWVLEEGFKVLFSEWATHDGENLFIWTLFTYLVLISKTAGKPDCKANCSSISGWSLAWAQSTLMGLSLKLLIVWINEWCYFFDHLKVDWSLFRRGISDVREEHNNTERFLKTDTVLFPSVRRNDPWKQETLWTFNLIISPFFESFSCSRTVIRSVNLLILVAWIINTLPPGTSTICGYPFSPKTESYILWIEASSLPTLATPFRLVASFAHSCLRVLQCPHYIALVKYPGSIKLNQPSIFGVIHQRIDVVGIKNNHVLLTGSSVNLIVCGQGADK